MRYFVIALTLLASQAAATEDRAFGVDGAIYRLKSDGTFEVVQAATQDGRVNLYVTAAHDEGTNCILRMKLTNKTVTVVRLLRKSFKVFTRRDNTLVSFYFGGKLASDAIVPGGTDEDDGKFEKGNCSDITGIEPETMGWSGIDPRNYHVDGMSAADSSKLLHYPDVGLIGIDPASE